MDIKEGSKCDKCSSGQLIFIETPNHIHHGKLECNLCGKWFKWVTQPNPEGIRKRVSKYSIEQVCKYYKMEKPICFFCLKNNNQLGFNETMTRDHIIEIDKGGEDELHNLQILCSACHKLKNWARLYTNWHLKK